MHYFSRRLLVGVCIAVIMMFVHKLARAETTPYLSGYGLVGTTFYSDADAYCGAKFSGGYKYNQGYAPNYVCIDHAGGPILGYANYSTVLCPYSFSANNGSCYRADCLSGQVRNPNTQACVVNTCPPVGQLSGDNMEAQTTKASLTICDANSCGFTGSGSIGHNGIYVVVGPFTSTGICSVGGNGATDPGAACSYRNPVTGVCEAACPSGQHYGQVPTGAMACIKSDNSPPLPPKQTACPYGYHDISATNVANCAPDTPSTPPPNTVCPPGTTLMGSAPGYCKLNSLIPPTTTAAPTTDNKTVGPTSTTSNADGSTTTSKTTTTTNSDGSTTTSTTTTTTKTDGTVTTGTTTSTGKIPGTTTDGTSTGTDADKSNFCKQNPTLAACQISVVSQADCTATVCTGDAVQCAILRQSLKTYCDSTKPTDDSTIGAQIIGGNDPQKGGFPSPTNGISVAMPSALSSSTFLGSACFPDTHFTIRGYSMAIPWTSACAYLVAFRYALMFVVLMMSFHMVTTSVLRET